MNLKKAKSLFVCLSLFVGAHLWSATSESQVDYSVSATQTYKLNLSMWYPDDATALRGAIIYTHGLFTPANPVDTTKKSSFQTRTQWQKLAREEGMALIGLCFTHGDPNEDVVQATGDVAPYASRDPWLTPPALKNGIDALADASGHSELKTVPLAFYGFSAGSGFSVRAAKYFKDRAFAASHDKGASLDYSGDDDSYTDKVPCLISFGTTDGTRTAVRDDFRFQRARGMPWFMFPDRGVGHQEDGDSHGFALLFIGRMAATRISGGGTTVGTGPTLAALSPTGSYQGTNSDGGTADTTFQDTMPTYSSATSYGTDAGTSWLPDEEIATAWQSVAANNRWGATTSYFVQATAGTATSITMSKGTDTATEIDWYVGTTKVFDGDGNATSYSFTPPKGGVYAVHARALVSGTWRSVGITVVVAAGASGSDPAWKTREQAIALSGNSTTITKGDTTPSTSDATDFGTAISGNTIDRTFTITNGGGKTLGMTGSTPVTLGGSGASAFSVTSQPGATIAAGSTSTFTIRYTASGDATHTATVSVASDDPNDNPFTFDISGTSSSTAKPEIAVSGNSTDITSGDTTPATGDSTDFGEAEQNVSAAAVEKTYTITNSGTGALTLGSNAVSLSGANASDFSVTAQPATSIAVGSSTTFTVKFSPTARGTRTATVSLANDDGNESPFTFAVQGTGTGLPAGWSHQDFVATGGSAKESGGTYTLKGAGNEIWGTQDECQFAYQTVTGDCTITGKVTSIQNVEQWSLAGLMIRESLTKGSRYAMGGVSASGGSVAYKRTSTDGTTTDVASSNTNKAPYWFRVKRVGNNFTIEQSSDGSSWTTTMTSTSITMASQVYVGLAVTSDLTGTTATGVFDSVTITTSDTTAPTNTSGWPKADTVTSSGFTVREKTNEAGTAYYVVVADGATAPTSAQVKAGANYGSVTVLKSGSLDLTANTEAAATISGLSTGTAYDVYVVAQDSSSNLQASATKVDITTLTPIQSWRETNFGQIAGTGNAADTADPDGDGIANLLEYALADTGSSLDPADANTAGLPTVTVESSKLKLSFERNTSATDVKYEIEASDDLATWTTIATRNAGASSWTFVSPVNVTDSGGAVTVTDSATITSTSRRFLRLKATVP
jgi:regulation of enolase protein 1 (concanavalin A-like superfamily)/dienelactone hydrolase